MAHLERPQLQKEIASRLSARLIGISVTVGVASFVVTELMYLGLVPDIGRHWERLLAEGFAAVVVAGLTAGFLNEANHRQEAALVRMQVISEMNHHIRNALGAIVLTTDSIQNQASVRVISESVDQIEWALREVLLRRKPMSEKEIHRLNFTVAKTRRRPADARQEISDE